MVGSQPRGIAITPDGKSAYVAVANSTTGVLTPIGLASNMSGTPITIEGEPYAVAIVPDSGPTAAFSAATAPASQPTTMPALQLNMSSGLFPLTVPYVRERRRAARRRARAIAEAPRVAGYGAFWIRGS
jgi:hypothetical protein